MATPVKTLLMEAILTALQTITAIDEVITGQAMPVDEETAVYPWACFFDEAETKTVNNRTMRREFDLTVQAWVNEQPGTTLDAQMELLDAEIERTLLNDTGIRDAAGAVEILATSSEKLFVDDGRGIMQAVYRVSYSTAARDPYDSGR